MKISLRARGMSLIEVIVACFLIALLGAILIRTAIVSYRIGHEEIERSTQETQAVLVSRRIESDLLASTAAGITLSEASRLLCHPIVKLSQNSEQLFDSKLIFWRIAGENPTRLVRSEIENHPALEDSENRGPVRLLSAELEALAADAGRKTLEVRGVTGFEVQNPAGVAIPQVGGALTVLIEIDLPLAATRKTIKLERTIMLRTSGGT